ncbi:MAG TPA: right-handed parallel beta-helix repeat-containing protein [Methanomassiliicoccales archaeon]
MRRLVTIVLVFAVVCAGILLLGVAKPSDINSHDYTIYRLSTGETVAVNMDTSQIEISGTIAGEVIQQAIDSSNNGTIWIEAGNYDVQSTIHTSGASIRGMGNSSNLIAHRGLNEAVIMISTDPDGARPSGITISDLQIDGNRTNQSYGDTIRGISFLDAVDCVVENVYIHDIISGQGVYMANSQHCTVRDSWIRDIGDNRGSGKLGNYGSGIAFGEQRTTASSDILIDNCSIAACSMSSIDLEPANHVTISNCRFTEARTWQNVPNPVITSYPISGYAPNEGIVITHNTMEGAFGEFVYLSESSNSIISQNWLRYTASYGAAIYCTDTTSCQITENNIGTLSQTAFAGVNCNLFNISNNTVADMTGSRSNYGIIVSASGGTSTHNIIEGNTVIGWAYGITANQGSQDTTITNNVFHNCTVGTLVTGSSQMYGNVYNGARASPMNDVPALLIGVVALLAAAMIAFIVVVRRKWKGV